VVLPPTILIFGFIKLKMLLRHRQRLAAEEEPPSEFHDINRDEKNVIFQLLIMLVVIMIAMFLMEIYARPKPNIENIEFMQALTSWLFIISLFFKDLFLISYVDERLNLKFLF
jgi:hypothetical protein